MESRSTLESLPAPRSHALTKATPLLRPECSHPWAADFTLAGESRGSEYLAHRRRFETAHIYSTVMLN